MLLKFSSLYFTYFLKDLFKNLSVIYFIKIKTPFSCNFTKFFVFPLLYTQLPSKVKLLSLILNIYFIGFQLFSEEKLYSSTSLILQILHLI